MRGRQDEIREIEFRPLIPLVTFIVTANIAANTMRSGLHLLAYIMIMVAIGFCVWVMHTLARETGRKLYRAAEVLWIVAGFICTVVYAAKLLI